MAEIHNIPVAEVTSLETLAANDNSDRNKIALIDARNNQVYCGVFDKEYNLLDKYTLEDTKENILSFVRDKDIKAEVEECFKDADSQLEFSWNHYNYNGVNGVTYSLKTSYEKSLKLLFIVFVKIEKVTYDVIPITVTERVKKCKRFLFVKKCHYENEQKQITPSLSDTQIQEIYKTGVAIAMEEVKKKYERYVDSIN